MRLYLKGKTVGLVTYQIIQYKVWKLSDYTTRCTVRRQEMSKCTRGARNVLIGTARGTKTRATLIYMYL